MMKRFDLESLRSRLLLLVVLAVVPIFVVTLITHVELRRVAADGAEREILRLARMAANDQRDSIRDTHQLLYTLSLLPNAQNPEPETCRPLLSEILGRNPQYSVMALGLPEGQLVCATPAIVGERIDFAAHTAFQKALETGGFAVEDYRSDDMGQLVTLDMAYPVIDALDQVQAVIFVSLDLSWLNRLAADSELPEGSTLIVVDRTGTILVAYPESEGWIGQPLPDTRMLQAITAHQGESTLETRGLDGVSRLFAFVPLFEIDEASALHVIVGIPAEVAFAETNQVLQRNLIALGFVTLLALSAAWLESDFFILRSVNRLSEVAGRLAEGDLDVRTHLSDGGELGQLAGIFDRMAAALTQRIAERDDAEAALHENRRRLQTLMSNLPGMAYRRYPGADWRMEFISEGAGELTGYQSSTLTGDVGMNGAYGQLVHSEDRERVNREIQEAVEANRPFEVDYRITNASGQVKWVEDKGRSVCLDQEGCVAIEGFISDVTERVQSQQILEQHVAARTRELSALYDVMAVINASQQLDTMLQRVLDGVLTVMSSAIGTIHLLDETSPVLHLAACGGLVPEVQNQIESLSATACGLPPEATSDAAPVLLSQLPALTDRAHVSVRIRSQRNLLGILSLVREAEQPFKAEEISLVELIANELGVAVENERLHQRSRQMAIVHERERLARELHDSVTQSLYSLTLLAEAGSQLARTGDTQRVGQYLARLSQISQQALKEMRLLVYELRPLALQREGLVGALQQRLDAVEKRAGVEARLLVEGLIDVPPPLETALYRIALEALNNILKHAAARNVTVRLEANPENLRLEIRDDGKGFDRDMSHGGMGMISMRERAEEIGATLRLDTSPDRGTCVQVDLELKAMRVAVTTRPEDGEEQEG
jgi:PAS domain S-box-containing protein